MADYEAALRIDAKSATRHNQIAWRLAVSPNDRVRNGKRAVEIATQACELSGWKNGNMLDTLAAAYAETGQFAEAIRWQEKALEDAGFARSSGPAMRQRLELYRAGKPYRD